MRTENPVEIHRKALSGRQLCRQLIPKETLMEAGFLPLSQIELLVDI